MNKYRHTRLFSALLAAGAFHGAAEAQVVVNDNLTGAASSYSWKALDGACLTAGDNTGSIPGCQTSAIFNYYAGQVQVGGVSGRLPDPVGKGALRLTNGSIYGGQTGAVVSDFTFPTNSGIQVTFTTATYGGNNYQGHGADGISFFLMDGAVNPTTAGGSGGSIGYSCSNTNYKSDGVLGAYIGVGIDEFGNFSNPGDTTDSGIGFQPGRISLRGSGNTTFAWLTANYPTLYPSNGKYWTFEAVQRTCATGRLWDYSGAGNYQDPTAPGPVPTNQVLRYNYRYISSADVRADEPIANQENDPFPLRATAVPITYALKITKAGRLSFSYSYKGGTSRPVLSNTPITASNGPLPDSFRFGFSGGSGGGTNVHEITCFKAAPVIDAQGSAGTGGQKLAQVEAGTQVYLAYSHTEEKWGELTAQNLLFDSTTNIVSIDPIATWNASCTLTGGPCAATGKTNAAIPPRSRTILTWGNSGGIPFKWSELSPAQQAALTVGDSSQSDARLRYLRGDRTNEEATKGGPFRDRDGILGDMQSSSPTWVGAPALPYSGPWVDALRPLLVKAPEAETGATSYDTFKAKFASRQNVVYLGANDGFLHAFRSGSYSGGRLVDSVTTPNDGLEILAYMPSTILAAIHSTTPSLDFSSPQYSHNTYVDGTPGTGDLFYKGAWHTWLVGGLGSGGNVNGPVADKQTAVGGTLFALDITDPTLFSESNANGLVLGDWNSNTLSCVGAPTCGSDLGSGYGTPLIRRLHNGSWAVLFGNGLNSTNGHAGLYIMVVNPTDGAKTFYFLDTNSGPEQDPTKQNAKNGITFITPADLDGDHVVDYVYAGDAFGNVWRFDLTDASPSKWAATAASKIFMTPAGTPITSAVAVASVPSTGIGSAPRVIVSFGTGQQFPQTLGGAATYAPGTQALYGVWDWNLGAWNSMAGFNAQYLSLKSPQSVTAAKLRAQTVTVVGTPSPGVSGYRSVSSLPICWQGSSACSSPDVNNQFGWTVALPGNNEQVIFNPLVQSGMFVVNTYIPSEGQILTCDRQSPTGYTMAVTLAGGGSAPNSFFPDPSNNFASYDGVSVAGIGLGATGTPSVITAKGRQYLVQQNIVGTGTVTQINPNAAAKGGRVNWIRLR